MVRYINRQRYNSQNKYKEVIPIPIFHQELLYEIRKKEFGNLFKGC